MQRLDLNNKKDQMIEFVFRDWFMYMTVVSQTLANDGDIEILIEYVEMLNEYERLYSELVYGPEAEPTISSLSEFLPK
jgi:hypothetical protein